MNHNYAMHVYLIHKYYHDDGQKCAVKIEYTVCILHFVKSFIKPNVAKPNFFLLILYCKSDLNTAGKRIVAFYTAQFAKMTGYT